MRGPHGRWSYPRLSKRVDFLLTPARSGCALIPGPRSEMTATICSKESKGSRRGLDAAPSWICLSLHNSGHQYGLQIRVVATSNLWRGGSAFPSRISWCTRTRRYGGAWARFTAGFAALLVLYPINGNRKPVTINTVTPLLRIAFHATYLQELKTNATACLQITLESIPTTPDSRVPTVERLREMNGGMNRCRRLKSVLGSSRATGPFLENPQHFDVRNRFLINIRSKARFRNQFVYRVEVVGIDSQPPKQLEPRRGVEYRQPPHSQPEPAFSVNLFKFSK